MFQDNVCHDLAVNKAAQPSKDYGTEHAAKYAPVPPKAAQRARPHQVCQCLKADLYALRHRLTRS
ncbi:hypothetical protein ABFP30_001065 [Enterobacter bugandensis]